MCHTYPKVLNCLYSNNFLPFFSIYPELTYIYICVFEHMNALTLGQVSACDFRFRLCFIHFHFFSSLPFSLFHFCFSLCKVCKNLFFPLFLLLSSNLGFLCSRVFSMFVYFVLWVACWLLFSLFLFRWVDAFFPSPLSYTTFSLLY